MRTIRRTILAGPGVTCAAVAVLVLDQGGFERPLAVAVVLVLAGAALVAATVAPLSRAERHLVAATGVFSAWWTVAALWWGTGWSGARGLVLGAVAWTAGLILAARWRPARADEPEVDPVTAGAAVLCVLCVAGVGAGVESWTLPSPGLDRLGGPLTAPNAMGVLLGLFVPSLAVRAAADDGSDGDRRLALLTLVATVTLVLATQSRTALLAVTLGVLALNGAARRAALVTLGGVLAVALVVLASPLGPGLDDVVSDRIGSDVLDARTPEWEAGIDQVREHPLLGAGPEHPVFVTDPGTGEPYATTLLHSEPIQIAAGGGLIAIGLFTALLVASGRSLSGDRRTPTSHTNHDRRRALGTVAVLLVGGLGDFAWHFPAIPAIAAVLAAHGPERTPR